MSMAGHFSHALSLALLVTTTWTGGLLAMTTSTTTSIPTSSAGQDSSCPPGMVCVHGYCPAGSVSCVCHPGWAGFQCEQACPADCSQNAACQTTPEGTPYCLCDDGLRYVTGRGCVNGTITIASPSNGDTSVTRSPNQTDPVSLTSGHTTANPPQTATGTGGQSGGVTTLRPAAERTCVPGFVCFHGQCAPDTIRCDCDEGWSGAFCSERCSKNCSEHGRCMVHLDGTSYCSCDWFYTGQLCEMERMVPSAAADPATTTTATTAPVNDSMRSLEERTCVPGFVCLHGRCAPSPTLACECDSGWAGAFCHQPCTLDCGPLGRCYTTGVGQELTMHCRCAGGYSGPRCQTSHLNDTGPDVDEGPATSVDWDVTDDLRPLSERQCVVGFVCLHGTCKEEGIECQCDSGWIGVFCHQPCPMNCVHGECRVHSNGSVQCNCEPEYTGVNCTEKRKFPEVATEDDTVQWIVVGVCGGLLLVLLVLLVVLPYWMWKRGHIFIMKIVYHFKSFEDDDKKLYDAFISYSRMDDDFVVQQLFPKLTEMKFKVCVHKKDFIPGETIANNIIEAVENSRRTILVVSPDFIHSEFCRFEYQQAQYEMIKRRQRIVPVVLRDVTKEKKNMDATLRSILETITYLDWPEDGDPRKVERFWKRLELSMPKRKSRPESSSSQYDTSAYSRLDSTSSGYSSCSSKAGGKTTTTSSTSSSGSHSVSGAVQQQAKKSRSSRSSQSKSSRDSRPAKRGHRGNGGSSSSTSASWSKSKATDLDSVTIEMDRHDRNQRGCAGYTNGYNNAAYSLK